MLRKFNTPVLLIGFNRPDLTSRALAQIRKIKPTKLYFAVDGGRSDSDHNKVQAVRDLIKKVDWSSKVKLNFSNENYGCKYGPVRAMNWFFKNEEMGIILEDDILADESFFYFAEKLLMRYKDNNNIGSISGSNFHFGHKHGNASYYFSRYSHTWGWATWRRAWKQFDSEVEIWPRLRKENFLKRIFDNRLDRFYWQLIFDGVHSLEIDSAWDYQWTLMMWSKEMLAIIPNRNLVKNIGFGGSDATHTKLRDRFSDMEIKPMIFPLIHPQKVVRNKRADELIQRQNYILWKEICMKFIRKIYRIKGVLVSLK